MAEKYLDAQTAREELTDALRKGGMGRRNAEKMADGSVGRVFDQHEKRGSGSEIPTNRAGRNR